MRWWEVKGRMAICPVLGGQSRFFRPVAVKLWNDPLFADKPGVLAAKPADNDKK